jgi:hypothetical protein
MRLRQAMAVCSVEGAVLALQQCLMLRRVQAGSVAEMLLAVLEAETPVLEQARRCWQRRERALARKGQG